MGAQSKGSHRAVSTHSLRNDGVMNVHLFQTECSKNGISKDAFIRFECFSITFAFCNKTEALLEAGSEAV